MRDETGRQGAPFHLWMSAPCGEPVTGFDMVACLLGHPDENLSDRDSPGGLCRGLRGDASRARSLNLMQLFHRVMNDRETSAEDEEHQYREGEDESPCNQAIRAFG